jgi:carbamoyltransferase
LGKKYSLLLSRHEHREIAAKRGRLPSLLHFLLSDRQGHLPPVAEFEETWEPFFSALTHDLELGPADMDVVVGSESHFALNRRWLGRRLSSYFRNAAVYTDLEHHAIHRYQAFFASGWNEAAVLTADACGEPLERLDGAKLAMTLSTAIGNDFDIHAEHCFPNSSPGYLYDAFNRYLGFSPGEEGKTMGLSSFGGDACYLRLVELLQLGDDGSLRFVDNQRLHQELQQFGARPRQPDEPVLPLHQDVAAAGQRLLEDIMCNAVQALRRRTSVRKLCLAGGVALNSVANERCFRASGFDDLYVMPNAGDVGQALGCALWAERVLFGKQDRRLPHDFLGPTYSRDSIQAEVDRAGLAVRQLDNPFDEAARLIERGRILAWFQGGSEYGPRALGHRSILADCRPAGIKDHLNARVKFREGFRPYAPAVLEDRATEWFDLQGTSSFMLRVVEVRPEKAHILAGVTHVDGTARVQTVCRRSNREFYDLIAAFERRTGVPVVLNTSFNIAGRPIVETPRDAIECFVSTSIDALVLHDLLIEKPQSSRESSVAPSPK